MLELALHAAQQNVYALYRRQTDNREQGDGENGSRGLPSAPVKRVRFALGRHRKFQRLSCVADQVCAA